MCVCVCVCVCVCATDVKIIKEYVGLIIKYGPST